MVIASSYKFGSNALFVSHKLKENGLDSVIEDEQNEELTFKVLVTENNLNKAITLIEKLEIIDSELDPESEGYLAGHNEWNDNMYSPGHYTSGKIPHWMHNKDIWKYLVPIYLICGIGIIGMVIFGYTSINTGTVIWSLVYIFCGGSMFWQLKNSK